MAKYRSQYSAMGFYVNDTYYRFQGTFFETEDKEVIEVLSKIGDVYRVDNEPKQAQKDEAKSEVKAQEVVADKTADDVKKATKPANK